MEGLIPVIIVAFIGLMIFAVWHGHQKAKQRRADLAAWASRHGLRFHGQSKDRSFDDRYPEFDCLKRGSNRYAYNIIDGEWRGRHLLAFDYHYETSSTDSKGRRRTTNHYFSAVILRANLPLQPLTIRRENLFDKVGSFFGFDDIDFESAEFSRRYCVRAPNRRWAYDVLHARAMQQLMNGPQFSLEMDQQQVIAWRSGTFKIHEFEDAVQVIEGLLDGLPNYVRQQQQTATDMAGVS